MLIILCINIHFTHSDLEPANSSVTCIDKNPLELHVYNYVSAASVCSVLQFNSYVYVNPWVWKVHREYTQGADVM